MSHFFRLTAVLFLFSAIVFGQSLSKTRTYYIAADEVDWDYAPGGVNKMMGTKFEGYSNTFVEKGPHRIGTVYRKAIYREYTDETFRQLKTRPAEWATAGILGPILRAEVGDTVKIIFKNNATRPYSMHPHGVFYDKDSEGATYDDGTSGADKEDDAVPPGKTHTYTWKVPERAGPGPNDPSSIVWLYHSHTNELRDVESGLIGAMIITRHGMADSDGKPKDDWAIPRKEFHQSLRRLVEAGFGKRIMFGSDQMVWPGAIDIAIEGIRSADFLSEEQKRDILYNNAARFLRWEPGK